MRSRNLNRATVISNLETPVGEIVLLFLLWWEVCPPSWIPPNFRDSDQLPVLCWWSINASLLGAVQPSCPKHFRFLKTKSLKRSPKRACRPLFVVGLKNLKGVIKRSYNLSGGFHATYEWISELFFSYLNIKRFLCSEKIDEGFHFACRIEVRTLIWYPPSLTLPNYDRYVGTTLVISPTIVAATYIFLEITKNSCHRKKENYTRLYFLTSLGGRCFSLMNRYTFSNFISTFWS